MPPVAPRGPRILPSSARLAALAALAASAAAAVAAASASAASSAEPLTNAADHQLDAVA